MNVTGIAITIKAWLPTGKGLDEQFTALSLVKTAHESGDYAPLLAAAKIEAVQTEQKTRREQQEAPVGNGIEDQPGDEHGREPEPTTTGEPGAAPTEKPDLIPDEPQKLPNPIGKGKKAAA